MLRLVLLLIAVSITVTLGGCKSLSGAGHSIEHGEMVQGAIKPPSRVVQGIEDGAAVVKLRIGDEGEGVTAAKIKEWGGTALEEVVDKGPDAYDAYKELDSDLDLHWDSNDNCPYVFNPDQENSDNFGAGNACDDSENADSDSRIDIIDNCPNVWNSSQVDHDGDEVGDACDFDMDGDLRWNVVDSDMDGDGYIYEGNVDLDRDGHIYKTDLDNDADGALNEDDNFDWAPAYY
jgi:Thrombospondin type 3 repeat